jgi:hypothetical protein
MLRRQIPLIITFIIGISIAAQYFIPHWPFNQLVSTFNMWFLVILFFTLTLGVGNLIKLHGRKVYKKTPGWGYSVVLIVAVVTMSVAGIGWGLESGTFAYWLWQNMHIPMASTMFALLAFFIASASYRAFRARTVEATLLLAAAIVVMLGRVPLGALIHDKLPDLADWIMSYPNMAGQRAILIGIALGTVSYCLRVILGIERTYLGGGK